MGVGGSERLFLIMVIFPKQIYKGEAVRYDGSPTVTLKIRRQISLPPSSLLPLQRLVLAVPLADGSLHFEI